MGFLRYRRFQHGSSNSQGTIVGAEGGALGPIRLFSLGLPDRFWMPVRLPRPLQYGNQYFPLQRLLQSILDKWCASICEPGICGYLGRRRLHLQSADLLKLVQLWQRKRFHPQCLARPGRIPGSTDSAPGGLWDLRFVGRPPTAQADSQRHTIEHCLHV